MDSDSLLLLLLFALFVLLGGYFAGSESCFTAMNKIRIKNMAAEGNRRAKGAMYIANNFDLALTTLLIGNNLTHIAAASVATVFAERMWSHPNTSVASTFVTTAIVFLFSEMIPKSFANDRSESMSLACANSLRGLMKLFSPIAKFFMWITSLFTRLFTVKEQPTVTEAELYDIIETIEEEGVMGEEESDLFKSALDFSRTTVADIMTMRGDIVALDVGAPTEQSIEIIRKTNHSRLPVFEGDLDHIVGTLQIRNFIKEYLKNRGVTIREMMTDAYRAKETDGINELLTRMRHQKAYLAVVADGEGRTEGVVTIEDFLEELVGEIWDEDDVVDRDFMKLGGNRFQISPRMRVGEAFSRMGYAPPRKEPFLDKPLISWIAETLGHAPEEGETFRYDRLEVEIGDVKEGRVLNAEIHLMDD